MGALKDAMGLIEAATKFKEQLMGMLPGAEGAAAPEAKEDDPLLMKPTGIEGMSYGPKLEDETWPEYFIRWGTNNPTAMEKIMGKMMQVLDPATIQKVITAIAERGGKKGGGGTPAPAGLPSAAAGAQEQPKKGWVPD